MMTSDSEESDYEDARQHHDNEVDPDYVLPREASPPPLQRPRILHPPSIVASSSGESNPSVSPQVGVANNGGDRDNNDGANIRMEEQDNAPAENDVGVVADVPNNDEAVILQRAEEVLGVFVNFVDNVYVPNQNQPQEPPPLEDNPGPQANEALQRIQAHVARLRELYPMVVDSDSDDELGMGVYSDDDSDAELLVQPQNNAEGESDRAGSTSDANDAQDAADLDDVPEFDQELPIRHSYLGEGMEELQGRVVLEEDATPEIPLIAMGQHLIPGQTLPLQVYHAVFQNAIRRCVMGDRLFGIVHNDLNPPGGNVIYIGALGTLAEIFEFQEESEGEGNGGMSSTFAVKAKGRQRFNVMEVRRQADGNLMGKVRIRPEIRLESFVLTVLSPATSRTFLPPVTEDFNDVEESESERAILEIPNADSASPSILLPSSRTSVSRASRSSLLSSRLSFSRRDSVSSVSTVTNPAAMEHDLKSLQMKIGSQRKRLKYYAAMTAHPYFVYEHYDETVLVEKVHRLLTNELKGVAKSKGKIPMDATDLSFWLAQNLLIDDSHRSKVLKMDCPIQRLRYYLELLGRTTKVISCRNCESAIADHSQIFSMSIEGPQGTYVNPHGFVHETLTVYKTRDLVTRGGPSTEASWFPGYSWTIVECKRCRSHIGWKFQAVGRLKPARFWGLARRSVISKYNFGSDSDIQESLDMDTFRTPPNSANSEAYSTVALF